MQSTLTEAWSSDGPEKKIVFDAAASIGLHIANKGFVTANKGFVTANTGF